MDIIIFGASGHAKVIIDIIEKTEIHKIVGLVDDTSSAKSFVMGYPVEKDIGSYLDSGVNAGLVAIGDNWQRKSIVSKILNKCSYFNFVTAIHPSVSIGREVTIGVGTVIMAGSNINPGTKIYNHCIVNTGTNVDHDCTVNDFASLAPGVNLGGNVVIENCSAVGLGTSVIQKISIGEHTVIGAGSVVIKNLPSNCIAFGTPCKFIRERDRDEPYL